MPSDPYNYFGNTKPQIFPSECTAQMESLNNKYLTAKFMKPYKNGFINAEKKAAHRRPL